MVGGKCGSRGGEQTWGGSSFWRFDSVVLSSARGSKRKLECAGACSIWPIECRKGRAERSRIMGSSWKQTISVTRPCRSNLRSLESCLALPLPTLAGGLPIAPAFQASSVENHGRVSQNRRACLSQVISAPEDPVILGVGGCASVRLSPPLPLITDTPPRGQHPECLSRRRHPVGRYPGHTAPLDAIMRVPTRRQGRSRATYQFRVSGMRLSPRRERSPFPSLVSTTTAQPEDIKLALSRAEPPIRS
jgi:hypothetical protein